MAGGDRSPRWTARSKRPHAGGGGAGQGRRAVAETPREAPERAQVGEAQLHQWAAGLAERHTPGNDGDERRDRGS